MGKYFLCRSNHFVKLRKGTPIFNQMDKNRYCPWLKQSGWRSITANGGEATCIVSAWFLKDLRQVDVLFLSPFIRLRQETGPSTSAVPSRSALRFKVNCVPWTLTYEYVLSKMTLISFLSSHFHFEALVCEREIGSYWNTSELLTRAKRVYLTI